MTYNEGPECKQCGASIPWRRGEDAPELCNACQKIDELACECAGEKYEKIKEILDREIGEILDGVLNKY